MHGKVLIVSKLYPSPHPRIMFSIQSFYLLWIILNFYQNQRENLLSEQILIGFVLCFLKNIKRFRRALKMSDFKLKNYGNPGRFFKQNFSNKTFSVSPQNYKSIQLSRRDREQLTRVFNWWNSKKNSTLTNIFAAHAESTLPIFSSSLSVKSKSGKLGKDFFSFHDD